MTLEPFFCNNYKSVSNYLISPWSLLGRQQIHGKLTRMLCRQCTEITAVGTFIHLSTHFSIQLSTPYCSLSLWVTERPSPHPLVWWWDVDPQVDGLRKDLHVFHPSPPPPFQVGNQLNASEPPPGSKLCFGGSRGRLTQGSQHTQSEYIYISVCAEQLGEASKSV